jgi:hypothetical protein
MERRRKWIDTGGTLPLLMCQCNQSFGGRFMRVISAAILAAASFALPALATATTITSFTLPNNQPTCGIAIASDGTVAGNSQGISAPAVAFLYKAGTFTYPAVNGGPGVTSFTGVNRHGTVLGNNAYAAGTPLQLTVTSFLYSKGTTATLPIPGAVIVAADAINDAGTVVGYYQAGGDTGPVTGFQRLRNGTITSFANGPGITAPTAINRAGTKIVGYSGDVLSATSWLYQNGSFTPIVAPNVSATIARGVFGNTIVGTTFTASGSTYVAHGFIYKAGKYTAFDVPGAQQTSAAGANEHGQFTGCYMDSTGMHGFIATP